MTTIAINSHPDPSSTGRISALIVSVGLLAAVLGVVVWHFNTTHDAPANAGVSAWSSSNYSEYRFVSEGQQMPLDLRAPRTLAASRGWRGVIQPHRTVRTDRLYRLTVVDGVTIRKTLIGERLMRTPLDRLSLVGPWAPGASRGLFAGYDYLDMVATAYAPHCCRGVGEIAATGMKAGPGVVAVDPAVISLGSRLYIEGYGHAIAGDVGGAIKGRRIDLGFATKEAALQYGVQRVRVYLLAPN
ncbi:MAG TPA: 3D domain-containing protein [bacterium]|nr:3D domain-containing protein [bacterium]